VLLHDLASLEGIFLFYLNKSFFSIRSSSYIVTHCHRTSSEQKSENVVYLLPKILLYLRILSPFTRLLNNCSHVLMEEYMFFSFLIVIFLKKEICNAEIYMVIIWK